MSMNMQPFVPVPCTTCPDQAIHLVYNRTITSDQYFCEEHVPAEGTPRIKRRGYRPQGYEEQLPPPPGIIY